MQGRPFEVSVAATASQDKSVHVPFMQGRPFEVNCSYLVGCDGARSCVRRAAGIQMEGPTALQHLVNIHFFCPDLWQHIAQRPAMLYFVFNSDVVSVLVGHDLPNGELVAQVRACPSHSLLPDWT